MSCAASMGGRPQSEARQRLEQAVRFVSADFEALARFTGLPVEQVRRTLYNMRRSHVVAHAGSVRSPTNPRSTRRIYGPCDGSPGSPTAALASTLCHAWR